MKNVIIQLIIKVLYWSRLIIIQNHEQYITASLRVTTCNIKHKKYNRRRYPKSKLNSLNGYPKGVWGGGGGHFISTIVSIGYRGALQHGNLLVVIKVHLNKNTLLRIQRPATPHPNSHNKNSNACLYPPKY